MQKTIRSLLVSFAVIFGSLNSISAQYCFPTTTNNPASLSFFIARVRLGDIDNQDLTSPDVTAYDDYTQYGPWTNLTRGTAYSLTITGGPNATYFDRLYYAAWIDFNNDGDFSDAGEKLGQYKTVSANEVFNINFTVPATAVIDTTTLRIRCTYSGSAITVDPCATYLYGETEDYTAGISNFLKTATTVSGAPDWNVDFFNLDGDADYDLLTLDEYSDVAPVYFYTNNGSGTFTSNAYINSVTPAFKDYNLSSTFCDLNNDNGIDILFTSRYNEVTPRTLYFQKSGTKLYQTTTGFADLMRGSSEAADLNNDGRQDIIICGIGTDNLPHTYIYSNTPAGFVLVSDKLKAVAGPITVADYDNDHDIDILLTGKDRYGNFNALLYRNDNNWKFTEIFVNIYKKLDFLSPKPQFADFNSDGRLDLLCGKVYRNDGNNIFTEIAFEEGYNPLNSLEMSDIDNDGTIELMGRFDLGISIHKYNGVDSFLINQVLIDFYMGNIDIADVNGDKKPDIYSNNYPTAFIFRNQTTATNNIPSAPPEITSSIGDSGFYSVTLKWKAGTDDKTSRNALTYNLRVGTSTGGNQIFSSMTSISANNPLLKPGMGNVYNNTSWFLKNLAPGTYYWSVQTVDNSGLASAFATEKQFTILAPLIQSSLLVNGRINQASAGADLDGDKDIDLIIKDGVLTVHRQTTPYTYTAVPLRANCELLGINDLNNDNLPDIIVKHIKQTGELADSLELFINLGNMNFTTLRIDTLSSSYTLAAADFDNDGDIDIIAHNQGYFLFKNNGNLQFIRTKLLLPQVLFWSSLSPIDIDVDGDIDFMISGKETKSYSSSKCLSYVYKNNGDMNFSLSQNIIPAIGPTSFAIDAGAIATYPSDYTWNDFNFDGFPDLLATGDDEYANNTNQIFLNDGTGLLLTTSLSPRPADRYSSTWIDFNTDGYLDIIIPRISYNVDNSIYFNKDNVAFEGFGTSIDNIPFPAFIKAIDVDNDKDKDILVTNKIDLTVGFRTETTIYTNNNNKINQAPNPPTTTSSQIDVFDIILNWNNGWDKLTGYDGLTYNIWVGTVNNKADIVSPMADLTTGYRFVEALGNVGTNTSWRIKNLPLGTYYWSVQTIDNSLTPSAWSPVKSFTLSSLTANFSNDEVCFGFHTQLSDNSITTHPITSWKWVIGGKTVSTAQNPVFRFTTPGNNSVKLVVESSVAKDSITKNVFVKPIPEAAFTNNTVCAGSATAFTNNTNTNGLTVNEWHWDFGDNSGSNIQNPGTHGYLLAGTYNAVLVAVADNGCSDTIRKSVNVGMIPTAAVTLNGPPNFCSGDSVKLANSYSDTYIYTWQTAGVDITGANMNTYTAKQTGSYTVKVTNPVGSCVSVSSAINVTVKESPLQPAISYSGETEFCAGDSLLLSVAQTEGLVYKWKLNGGSVGSNINQHPAKIEGNYYLIVTNSDGCSSGSTNSVGVIVNNRPVAASLSPPSKPELCEGESIILGVTAFPAYGYQWLNDNVPVSGAVNNTYRVNVSGKYQLEISNAKGCSVKTNAISIAVNEKPLKPVIDSTGYKKGMCTGEKPLKLSVDDVLAGYSYQWYKNGAPISNSASVEDFFEDGSYYVEADLNGCKNASDSINMDFSEALPKPDLTAKGPNAWYLFTSAKADYYKWYYNDIQLPQAVSNTYIAGQKLGVYRVSISADNICFRVSDAVTIPAGIVGIEDPDPFEGVRIYPNPTTGMFTIEMDNNIFGNLIIDIYTPTGSKALNIKFEKTTEHFSSQIDLSGQAKGMYLINLAIDKFKATRKILIE